jgi:hypothetical protein
MRRIDNEDLPYPWEIIYTQWQFKWLLSPSVWNGLKDGHWAFSLQDDAMKQAGISHHAAFEVISLIKAEIDMRLDSVGPKDGDLCVARYYNEYSDEKIARMFGIPVEKVNRRIKRAMIYMAGKQKRVTYSQWIANGWSETPNPRKKPTSFLRNSSFEIKENTFCS